MKLLFFGPDCPALIKFLRQNEHTVITIEEPITTDTLDVLQPDFGISYRYRHIFKKPVIDWFCGKLVNLHIAYLPWNRGADPNLWSFLTKTPSGVTIHKIDTGLDTGSILVQRKVTHDIDKDTLESSYRRLTSAMEALFMESAETIFRGDIAPCPQDAQKATCHKLADKMPFEPLLAKKGWQTPLREIWGKGETHD